LSQADVKALLVLTQPPLVEGGAPGKCAVGLIRGLLAHGLDVHALAARQHFAAEGEVPADLPVEIVDVPPEPVTWRRHIRRWQRPRGELGRGPLAERVRDLAPGFDVLHLEETEAAWSDHGLAVPSVVHLHYLVRRDRELGLPWARQFRDVLETDLAERAAIRRHRHLVASSPLIAAELARRAPRATVTLAPLSLDPREYVPAPLDGAPTAGIIGTATWAPTARAMRQLVALWPTIRSGAPGARLLVAGRGAQRLGLATGDGVDVLGEVRSARAFFQGLSLLVYPVQRGSGMKVKVLEAMASGVPVVTTPAGAEGIAPNPGVVVEGDPVELASAAARILADADERKRRGLEARTAFDAHYAPVVATKPLVTLYRRMVGR
jgi:glycosyltransferase involved in cell wall biosynthesis